MNQKSNHKGLIKYFPKRYEHMVSTQDEISTIKSKYQPAPQQRNNIDNNLSINPASSKFPMPQNQSKDLSIFKTVATGTQILPGSVTASNNRMSQNLNMNSVMKNGKALNNIDINADTQSMVMSSNRGNQSNFPQASNAQYNNQLNYYY